MVAPERNAELRQLQLVLPVTEPVLSVNSFTWPPMAMRWPAIAVRLKLICRTSAHRAYRSPFYFPLWLIIRRHGPHAWGRSQWYSVTMGSMLAARSASTRRL